MNTSVSLKHNLESLAQDFAKQIVAVIYASSLEEVFRKSEDKAAERLHRKIIAAKKTTAKAAPVLMAEPKTRRNRRTPKQIDKQIEQIVGTLMAASGKKMTSEALRKELGWAFNKWQLPIKRAVKLGLVKQKGSRRVTEYSVP